MKFTAACLAGGLMTVLVYADPTTPPSAPAVPATPPSAKPGPAPAHPPAKPATPSPAPKKEEPPPKIPGLVIPRAKGGYLSLEIIENNFRLTFYNEKKKPGVVDVSRATLRWPVKYQPADERTVLNPSGDGHSLSSPKTVRPPRNFRVYLALFVEGNENAVENYVVDYRE